MSGPTKILLPEEGFIVSDDCTIAICPPYDPSAHFTGIHQLEGSDWGPQWYAYDNNGEPIVIDGFPVWPGGYEVVFGASDRLVAGEGLASLRAADGSDILIDGCFIEGTVAVRGYPAHFDMRNCLATEDGIRQRGLRIYGRNPNMSPERAELIRRLEQLSDDVPVLLLTPRSKAEMSAVEALVSAYTDAEIEGPFAETYRAMSEYAQGLPELPDLPRSEDGT